MAYQQTLCFDLPAKIEVYMLLSGLDWVGLFATSTSLAGLVELFGTKAKYFIAALRTGTTTITIGDTLRPPSERA